MAIQTIPSSTRSWPHFFFAAIIGILLAMLMTGCTMSDDHLKQTDDPGWPVFLKLGEVAVWSDGLGNDHITKVEVLAENGDMVTLLITRQHWELDDSSPRGHQTLRGHKEYWKDSRPHNLVIEQETVTCHRRRMPLVIKDGANSIDLDPQWTRETSIDDDDLERWNATIPITETYEYDVYVNIHGHLAPTISTMDGMSSSSFSWIRGLYLAKFDERDCCVHDVPNADAIRLYMVPWNPMDDRRDYKPEVFGLFGVGGGYLQFESKDADRQE